MRSIKLAFILYALLHVSQAWATFTLTQHPANTACGTAVSSCTVTLTSALTIDGHHFVAAIAHFQDTTTLIAATPSTNGGTNGAWFHCTCHGIDSTPTRGVDGAYMLVPVSSVSSITISFSASTTGAAVEILEIQFTLDAVLLSDERTRDQTTAVTNPSGVAFTIEPATNNVAIQAISSGGTVSAISGSYTNPADFNGFQGDAAWINTTSGSAPNWTTTSARAALNGMLFKEVTVPDIPLAGMELIPTPSQSFNGLSNSITTNVPGKAGATFILAWRSAAVPTGVSLADAMGSSISSLCTYTSRGANFIFYSWIGTFAYTGINTFVVSSTGSSSPGISFVEVRNLSTTTDTSCATANNNFVSFSAAVPAVTTATYRDFLIDFTDCSSTDVFGPAIGEVYAPLVGSSSLLPYMQYILTGNPGSYSTTLTDVNNRTCSEIVVAIKSTTSIAVSTRSIPDAIQGQSYHYQLDATSGLGTNNWTVTSGTLPTGLSLSSSGDLNGTCALSGTNPVTFTVTDSGSNTANKTLSVKCATSALSVSRVQAVTNGLALTSVGTDDCMIFQVSSTNGLYFVLPYDELGTVYTMLPGAATGLALGSGSGVGRSYTVLWMGCASSSGADTLHVNGMLGTKYYLTQYSNLQPTFDTKVLSITYSSSGGATITSNMITTPVSETLYSTAKVGTSGSTLAVQSPFTDFGANTGSFVVDAGDDIGAAIGSNSASYAQTGNTSNLWDIILFGLRPATSGTAPVGARRSSHVF